MTWTICERPPALMLPGLSPEGAARHGYSDRESGCVRSSLLGSIFLQCAYPYCGQCAVIVPATLFVSPPSPRTQPTPPPAPPPSHRLSFQPSTVQLFCNPHPHYQPYLAVSVRQEAGYPWDTTVHCRYDQDDGQSTPGHHYPNLPLPRPHYPRY